MASSAYAWQWDPRRRMYYIFSEEESCWIFQDGQRISKPKPQTETPQPDVQSASLPSTTTVDDIAEVMNRSKLITADDNRLPSETFDRNYRVRNSRFFKIGKVFRILWAEPAGSNNGSTVSQFRTGVHVKIRWFIVIKERPRYCTCLPLQTYGGQGVARLGVQKRHHSIIYTGSSPPRPQSAEEGMLPAIRVSKVNRAEELDPMTRVNYDKVYSIEHNCKVSEYGHVDQSSMATFKRNFNMVWDISSGTHDERGENAEDEDEGEDEYEYEYHQEDEDYYNDNGNDNEQDEGVFNRASDARRIKASETTDATEADYGHKQSKRR